MEYRYVGISSYGYDGEISMKQGDEGIVSNGMYVGRIIPNQIMSPYFIKAKLFWEAMI